jgi:N-acetylglucosamine-6-phosphate deacetylase
MRKCPACGANYDVLDALCPRCGRELPAPYEGWDGAGAAPRPDEGPIDADALTAALLDGEVMPEDTLILSGAEVMLGDSSFNPGSVVITKGKITEVLSFPINEPETGAGYANLSGMILAAGFVDMSATLPAGRIDAETFTTLSRQAAARGVTALLPRIEARSAEELAAVVEAFRAAQAQAVPGARLLGLRVETPFRDPAMASGDAFGFDDPRAQAMLALCEANKDIIRLVTLAPELPGAFASIHRLREAGIFVSLGVSAADYDDTLEAIEAGATHVTRLFQQMLPLQPLAPGLIGAALERDELFTEFSADPAVLHPAIMSMLISAKGAERALPAAPDGSPLTAVRTLVEAVGWDLTEALSMVAATPALCLGGKNFGSIEVGAVADLVILDQELNPLATLVGGGTVWQRE